MKHEYGRIWKKVVVAYSRHYTSICLEEPRKITINFIKIAGILPEIRPEHLSNTSLDKSRHNYPEYGGSNSFRDVGELLPDYTASYPNIKNSSKYNVVLTSLNKTSFVLNFLFFEHSANWEVI
jgi:hypothetical protein